MTEMNIYNIIYLAEGKERKLRVGIMGRKGKGLRLFWRIIYFLKEVQDFL